MLECIYRLDFEIELLTGLHIGGSTDTFVSAVLIQLL